MTTASELTIDSSATALDMANAMFGEGVTITSASYSGDDQSSGIFSGGTTTSPGFAPSDSGVILSTGKASDVTNDGDDPNKVAWTTTNTSGVDGDSDFNAIAGTSTYDAAFIEASFVPDGDTLSMQIVFSSEEYLEYVNSGFNDAVGIWVNGVKAELTVGTGDVSIDNINDEINHNLYVDNPKSDDTYNTEMDGFTVTLTLKAPVIAGQENEIKIGVADAGDAAYDSNLLIKGDSIQTAVIAQDDEAEVETDGHTDIDVLSNDTDVSGGALTITAINGVSVEPGDSVILGDGSVVTLNDDGTLGFDATSDEGTGTFTYEVTDDDGNTDTAFVEVETVPCFAAGTMVDTPNGPKAVEKLRPGDLVDTVDHGPRPLVWVGSVKVQATGSAAPVRLSRGYLGLTRDVILSPLHRVVVASARVELTTGQAEALIAARDLVDGINVHRLPAGQEIRYVHLLFDRHELVHTSGLVSESFNPGAVGLDAFGPAQRAEILQLFPDLARPDHAGFTSARPCLKGYEVPVALASLPVSPACGHNQMAQRQDA